MSTRASRAAGAVQAYYDEMTNYGANSMYMLVGKFLSQQHVTQGSQHYGFWTDGLMVQTSAPMAQVSTVPTSHGRPDPRPELHHRRASASARQGGGSRRTAATPQTRGPASPSSIPGCRSASARSSRTRPTLSASRASPSCSTTSSERHARRDVLWLGERRLVLCGARRRQGAHATG